MRRVLAAVTSGGWQAHVRPGRDADKPVVAVSLLFAKTTDDDLAQLKSLTSLERLDLGGRVSIQTANFTSQESIDVANGQTLTVTRICICHSCGLHSDTRD